jgi:hypothetical protein
MKDRTQRMLLTAGELLFALGAIALGSLRVWPMNTALAVACVVSTLALFTYPRRPQLS